MHPFFRAWIFAVRPENAVKFDTVHENETGYIFVLASVALNAHDATETGFCFGENEKSACRFTILEG
ncbi:hypothetical protein F0Q32_02655 [Pseudocitrobacter sp. 73]|nr:hypothetical protein F0Q32_02655 [Pseudocitrobacter sp. 73]